jgi:hypothetical protein
MMDVGKAAVLGNVPLRQIGCAQELLGMLDAQPQRNDWRLTGSPSNQ